MQGTADGRATQTRRRMLTRLGTGAGITALAGCFDQSTDEPTPTGTDDSRSFVEWAVETGHARLGQPTIAPVGDPSTAALYVGSEPPYSGRETPAATDHTLYAFTLQGGESHWERPLEHGLQSTPMYGGDDGPARLYLATGPRSLHGTESSLLAVEPVSGEVRWRFTPDERRFVYPLVGDDDAVYVGRRDDTLQPTGEVVYAREASDGSARWRTPSGDARRTGHAVLRETVFVNTRRGLQALEPASGDERWVADPDAGIAYANDGERVFVGRDDTVSALPVADGSAVWRRSFDFTVSVVTSPRAALSETVFVGDADAGRLLALSPLSGETRWRRSIGGAGFTPRIRRTSERLFVGGPGVFALDPVSGDTEWSVLTDIEHAVDVAASTTVFAHVPAEGTLYAIDPETGDIRWEYDPTDELVGVTTAGDFAWVTVGGTVSALDGSS